jgi:hypothetical protein
LMAESHWITGSGQAVFDASPFTWQSQYSSWQTIGRYEMYDSSHPNWDKDLNGDSGGNFILSKYEEIPRPFDVGILNGGGPGPFSGTTIPGPLFNPQGLLGNTGVASSMSNSSLQLLGTKAISLTAPSKSAFDAVTALGDTLEEVPRAPISGLLKSRTKDALKASGDEYLNLAFGWIPLVSDITKFCHVVKNHKKILDGYASGANKKLRKRHIFQPLSTSTREDGQFISSVPHGFLSASETATLSERTWFAGAFRYYLPVGSSTMEKFQRFEEQANHLLGIRLTPSAVWELTPWSWMADWYSNAGDVASNISSLGTDGLTMQYGYIMHESKSSYARICHDYPMALNIESKSCQRLAANPFGFQVDLEALTNRQIAILAALGLSKNGKPWRIN